MTIEAGVFSSTLKAPEPESMVGASLTLVTVTATLLVALRPPESETFTVTL